MQTEKNQDCCEKCGSHSFIIIPIPHSLTFKYICGNCDHETEKTFKSESDWASFESKRLKLVINSLKEEIKSTPELNN